MRHIKGTYTDEEYNEIVRIKNESGLSWDVFIRKAAECYDKFGEIKDE